MTVTSTNIEGIASIFVTYPPSLPTRISIVGTFEMMSQTNPTAITIKMSPSPGGPITSTGQSLALTNSSGRPDLTILESLISSLTFGQLAIFLIVLLTVCFFLLTSRRGRKTTR